MHTIWGDWSTKYNLLKMHKIDTRFDTRTVLHTSTNIHLHIHKNTYKISIYIHVIYILLLPSKHFNSPISVFCRKCMNSYTKVVVCSEPMSYPVIFVSFFFWSLDLIGHFLFCPLVSLPLLVWHWVEVWFEFQISVSVSFLYTQPMGFLTIKIFSSEWKFWIPSSGYLFFIFVPQN